MKDIKTMDKKEFAFLFDYSAVSQMNTMEEVDHVCQETLDKGLGAAYFLPCHVKWAREKYGPDLFIGTAISFPFGTSDTCIKVAEGLQSIEDGATALDVVINVSMLKSNNFAYVKQDIDECVKAWKEKKPEITVKVICECADLTHEQKLEAFKIVKEAGADVIKTSTGWGSYGARVDDVMLMKEIVGDDLLIKAAGDFTNAGEALALVAAGADQLGNAYQDCDGALATFDEYIGHFR